MHMEATRQRLSDKKTVNYNDIAAYEDYITRRKLENTQKKRNWNNLNNIKTQEKMRRTEDFEKYRKDDNENKDWVVFLCLCLFIIAGLLGALFS